MPPFPPEATPNAAQFARKLPLQNADSEFLCLVDEHEARAWIAQRKVVLLWSKKRIRALRLTEAASAEMATETANTTPASGRYYSHDSETPENPHGCWTLVEIPRSTRDLFLTVVTGCKKAA